MLSAMAAICKNARIVQNLRAAERTTPERHQCSFFNSRGVCERRQRSAGTRNVTRGSLGAEAEDALEAVGPLEGEKGRNGSGLPEPGRSKPASPQAPAAYTPPVTKRSDEQAPEGWRPPTRLQGGVRATAPTFLAGSGGVMARPPLCSAVALRSITGRRRRPLCPGSPSPPDCDPDRPVVVGRVFTETQPPP